jgi:esterase/lipase
MRYEPAELARGISLPMLVITGGNDIQVSTDNGDRIAEVAPNAKHITFERMTHVLKDFNSKDRVEQVVNIYVNAKASLTDGLVSSIVDFVNNIKY